MTFLGHEKPALSNRQMFINLVQLFNRRDP